MTHLDSILKSRDITLLTKVCIVKTIVFSSSHLGMLELDCKEGWALKNWCFRTVVVVKTLESPLDCQIKSVSPKGNQSWIFTGRTDVEAPVLWPPDVKSQLVGKDPDAGKDWRAGGEVGNRGWDGWMASPTQWMWVWANSGRWWRTGKPCVLQSMGYKELDMTERLNNSNNNEASTI